MISVIVPVQESDEALAGLFAVLVPAAVEGLVRDVVVVGGDASGPLRPSAALARG